MRRTIPVDFEAESQRLVRNAKDRARVEQLEAALAACLHYIAALNGVPSDVPEDECTVNAKKLLGWTL
jgi:hypothetical protein